LPIFNSSNKDPSAQHIFWCKLSDEGILTLQTFVTYTNRILPLPATNSLLDQALKYLRFQRCSQ